MSVSLISTEGASKAFIALIDAVSRGIGTLYEPWRIRKNADAKAYEMQTLAEAEKKKNEILSAAEAQTGKIIPQEQLQAIVSRIVGKEIVRQENIDRVVSIALENLGKAKAISDKKVETDWLTRFFDIVEDISDDELRNAWGKVLSQEIQTPGSFSLRTLSTIRNLAKNEAELFASLGNNVFSSANTKFFLKSKNSILGSNVQYDAITLLMECGLIKENDDLAFSYRATPDEKTKFAFTYQDLAVIIELDKGDYEINVDIYELTRAGSEIYKILNVEKDMSLLEKAASIIKKPNVSFAYSKLIGVSGNTINSEKDLTYL